MIKYYDGTIFNTHANALVNTINTIGVMGAGIALEFSLRYPDMYEDYKIKCANKTIRVGENYYFKNKDGTIIINFPTKTHFKYPSKIEWIEQGLSNFRDTYKSNNIESVAFPKLGCLNGGLNWNQVHPLMLKYLTDLDIEVLICLDNLPFAEGIEKEMVDKFNSTSIDELSSKVRLNAKQKDCVEKSIPIKRFWHISKIESIGNKTYETIFKSFYSLDKDNLNNQLKFF